MAWPQQRTAVLVIHGIGQQSPFDTLDKFTRNFFQALTSQNEQGEVILAHHLANHGDWAQNYISLINDNDHSTAVDCYEYYWANETQRKISMAGVFNWLVDTGKRARDYYDVNPDRRPPEGERKNTPFGSVGISGRFDKHWYLKSAGTLLGFIRLAIPLLEVVARIPKVGTPVKIAAIVMAKLLKPIVVDVIGDVALYTSTDVKSEYFPVRQRILDGAVATIEALFGSTEPVYGRIVVVGHSLGSVVGYDALNRINNRMNAGITDRAAASKITGFVTLGSPLDKIAFFFRRRGGKEQTILRQMVGQNVSFRSRDIDDDLSSLQPRLESHIEDLVGAKLTWLNFWDPKDPISGHLDFYRVDDNWSLNMGEPWGKAHVGYWEFPEMYRRIIDQAVN